MEAKPEGATHGICKYCGDAKLYEYRKTGTSWRVECLACGRQDVRSTQDGARHHDPRKLAPGAKIPASRRQARTT
jgi:hypothetical protein